MLVASKDGIVETEYATGAGHLRSFGCGVIQRQRNRRISYDNLLRYVGNNPVNMIDPSGKESIDGTPKTKPSYSMILELVNQFILLTNFSGASVLRDEAELKNLTSPPPLDGNGLGFSIVRDPRQNLPIGRGGRQPPPPLPPTPLARDQAIVFHGVGPYQTTVGAELDRLKDLPVRERELAAARTSLQELRGLCKEVGYSDLIEAIDRHEPVSDPNQIRSVKEYWTQPTQRTYVGGFAITKFGYERTRDGYTVTYVLKSNAEYSNVGPTTGNVSSLPAVDVPIATGTFALPDAPESDVSSALEKYDKAIEKRVHELFELQSMRDAVDTLENAGQLVPFFTAIDNYRQGKPWKLDAAIDAALIFGPFVLGVVARSGGRMLRPLILSVELSTRELAPIRVTEGLLGPEISEMGKAIPRPSYGWNVAVNGNEIAATLGGATIEATVLKDGTLEVWDIFTKPLGTGFSEPLPGMIPSVPQGAGAASLIEVLEKSQIK